MAHIFPRESTPALPTAVRGEGCYLTDAAGKQYLDGSGGAAVSCLGHGDREIIDTVKQQLDEMAFAHTSFFTSEPAQRLADLLIEHAPRSLQRVFFVSGGSEANEAAIKLARQYWVERGEPQRTKLIARRLSYHGSTLGALSAGGSAERRSVFEPILLDTSHIEPCYSYRMQQPDESPEEYGRRAAMALEVEIQQLGPENVMAFLAETVVGATAGALAAAPTYFQHIREICDRHNILLILDEVMCGTGRTGTMWACEQEGVNPDIASIAKGLGGGYQPVGAMLCTEEIYTTIADSAGTFRHGHTYLAHPAATAAGFAVVSAIVERQLLPQVQERGKQLDETLTRRFGQHPHVGDVRGRGLFWGIELVRDRDTKQPFPRALKVAAQLKAATFAEGLICYPMGAELDGREGDHILLAPPFIISEDQIGELVDKLERAMQKVLDALPR